MIGLIKMTCLMTYGREYPQPEDPHDTRTFFVTPELLQPIADWYREHGWEVIQEDI